MTRWRPQRIVQVVAVVFAASETLVRAFYYLDDTDSRISYGESWYPSNITGIDVTKLFNGTS